MSIGAMAVPRACGKTREQGGVYIENGGGNAVIEDFMLCPPPKITQGMGVSDIGTTVVTLPHKECASVIDMIGKTYYPYPVYWIEETRRFGLSRKISKSVALKLEPNSMIIMAHRRAYVENFKDYPHHYTCPILRPDHKEYSEVDMCLGFVWEDLEMGGDDIVQITPQIIKEHGMNPFVGRATYSKQALEHLLQGVLVTLPAASFYAHLRPEGMTPEYYEHGAMFAAFPISRIVVVEAEDGSHKETLDELHDKSDLIVDQVEY